MQFRPALDELRAALKEICRPREDLAGQIEEIEALRPRFNHSILLVKKTPENVPDDCRVDCFAYALGLPPPYPLSPSKGKIIRPSNLFVSHLIPEHLNPVREPRDGDIAVYFNAGAQIVHAGIWDAGRIRSKWGGGHIWDHPPFETSSCYGSEIRSYRVAGDLAAEWQDFASRWP